MLLHSAAMIVRSPVTAVALIGSVAVHASVFMGMPRGAPSIEAPATVAPSEEVDVGVASDTNVANAATPVTAPESRDHAPVRPAAPARPAVREAPRAIYDARTTPIEPSAAVEAAPAPLHFVMNVAPLASSAVVPEGASERQGAGALQVGERQGASESPGTPRGDTIYGEEGVDVRPLLLTWHAPRYPDAAASAGVEVDVPVDVVIDTSGAVIDVRLPKHFGYGLDEAAVAAARSYRFSGSRKAGRPVRVRMRCTVMFRLN
jgi:periplasmic protein TonB